MLIDNRYVPRHEKSFTVCHWLNATSYAVNYGVAALRGHFPFPVQHFRCENFAICSQILCRDFYLHADFRVAVGSQRILHTF